MGTVNGALNCGDVTAGTPVAPSSEIVHAVATDTIPAVAGSLTAVAPKTIALRIGNDR